MANQLNRALNYLVHDPVGEEIGEGLVGATLVTAPELFGEQPLEQTGLQFALAALGGVGLGMGGRRLGAFAGERLHPKALKDQGGFLAGLGRTLGNDTTIQGISEQGRIGKDAVANQLLNSTSSDMAYQAAIDPEGFAKEFGISADVFNAQLPNIQKGQKVAMGLEALKAAPPEQRKAIVDDLLGEYNKVEKTIRKKAAADMDGKLDAIADLLSSPEGVKEMDEITGGMGQALSEAAQKLAAKGPAEEITGKHVGKAIGRMAGDEIGILAGLGVANLLYNGSEEQA